MTIATLRRAAARLFCCIMFVPAAAAMTPPEGTISPGQPELVAEGGPYLMSNPTGAATGEPLCLGGLCDEFLLNVDIGDAFRNSHPDHVLRFTLEWTPALNDLDLYVRDAATGTLLGASASASPVETVQLAIADLPEQLRVEIVPFLVTGSTATLRIALAPGEDLDPCLPGGDGGADMQVLLDLETLAAGAVYGAFVHFRAGTAKQQDALLQALGLNLQRDFRRYTRAVYASGPASAFLALLRHPLVGHLEHNRRLRYFGATAPWATRARVAQEAVAGGPYFDGDGRMLNGDSVTLGVIDSGLFGAHPDFAGRILHNFKLVLPGLITDPLYLDVGTLDTESQVGGHGTHVTGIVAGGGHASDGGYPLPETAPKVPGTFTGVAPGARIIHWGNGAALFVLDVASAYTHLLDNLDGFDPPLRAVNNSYGDDGGTPHNPGSVTACLVKEIVDHGVVMVFAAGNDGGSGTEDRTSSQCKDPTPGVICVASQDDLGTGDRDGPLSGFSSRAERGRPDIYPDIAAPGDLITATCLQALPSQAICTGGSDSVIEDHWFPWYGTISGTSMAAPHVTGVIGLMTQLRPELTPAEIERVIKDTARKVGDDYEPDPRNPGGTTHFGYGAGLIDVPAILDALGADKAGMPQQGGEWVVFDGNSGAGDGAADVVRLSMQEDTRGGLPGIVYRLRLRDADDFGSTAALRYRIEQNVAGRAFTTAVVADADAIAIPDGGEDNSAVATEAVREGDELHLFVPYAHLGWPVPGEPVHNIRVVVEQGFGARAFAPWPAGAPTLLAPMRPMYGRAFTVQLDAGSPPPSDERSCTLPGITVLTSPPGTTGNGTPTGQDDLRRVWIAEPEDMPGRIVFTMQVETLAAAPLPAHRWYVYFRLPDDPADYWVAMDTLLAAPRFLYGTRDAIDLPAVGGVGTFSVLGELDPASGFDPEGLISLVLDKNALGIAPDMTLADVAASVRLTTNPLNGIGLTSDTAAGRSYAVVGNGVCADRDGLTHPGSGSSSGNSGGLLCLLLAGMLLRRYWHKTC